MHALFPFDSSSHPEPPTQSNTDNDNGRLTAFELGKFAAAQAALERGLALRSGVDADSRKYGAWLRKCRLELEEEQEQQGQGQAGKSSGGNSSSSTPAVIGPAKYQYYQSGTHVTVTLLQKGVAEDKADVTIEPRRVCSFFMIVPLCQVRWDGLYHHRGTDPSFPCFTQPPQLTVAVKGGERRAVVLFDQQLFDAVDPAESQAIFRPTKVRLRPSVCMGR